MTPFAIHGLLKCDQTVNKLSMKFMNISSHRVLVLSSVVCI